MNFNDERFIDVFIRVLECEGIMSCHYYCENLGIELGLFLASNGRNKTQSSFKAIIKGAECWCNTYTVTLHKNLKEDEFKIVITDKKVTYEELCFGESEFYNDHDGILRPEDVKLPITFTYKISSYLTKGNKK